MRIVKKLMYYTELILINVAIWIILNESLSWLTIISGVIFAMITIVITNNLLLLSDYKKMYKIRPMLLVKYGLYLIIQIYAAGFGAIAKIISGKINADIVEIETKLEDELQRCILANSITLTPGTVTVDKKGNKLTVLWLDCETKDSERAGEMIKGKFEKILLGERG